MAYTVTNYQTKKALLADFKAGKLIQCFQPGGIYPLRSGPNTLEGPHYPKPHRWYASCEIDANGIATKIK